MEIYGTVLSLLDINKDEIDDAKKAQIESIIDVVSDRLKGKLTTMLGKTVDFVPEELSGIVVEVSVNRFNRIGSEGASSHNVDGETFAWNDSDYFGPYKEDIDNYVAAQGHSVGVKFI